MVFAIIVISIDFIVDHLSTIIIVPIEVGHFLYFTSFEVVIELLPFQNRFLEKPFSFAISLIPQDQLHHHPHRRLHHHHRLKDHQHLHHRRLRLNQFHPHHRLHLTLGLVQVLSFIIIVEQLQQVSIALWLFVIIGQLLLVIQLA